MLIRAFLRPSILAIAAVSIGQPSLAHHSGAMWDSSTTVSLHGTVKQFQWSNPHCFIQLLVPVAGASNGDVEEWSIEMASPFQVLQGGWKPSTLKPGDHIRVSVHPARDGSHAGNFVSAVSADGQPLTAAPPIHPSSRTPLAPPR
jgi:Family of unknown function (DUF6152)